MKWTCLLTAIATGFLPAATRLAAAEPEPELLNGVAAIVNHTTITVEDVHAISRRSLQTAADRARRRSQLDPSGAEKQFQTDATRIQKDGLEQLIDRQLILDEFETTGIKLPDSLIEDIVNDRIKREFGDRATFIKSLRDRNETVESFRKDERDSFIVRQMIIKNIRQEIVISPKKIDRYYRDHQDKYAVSDRVKLRVILLDARKRPKGEPARLGAELVQKLRGGADFAQTADENSDDVRLYKGGDRGWIEDKDSDLRKELRSVAFALKAGEVSDPVELEGSIFVLKAEEKQAAQVRPLADVRLEIEAELKTEESDRLQKKWVAKLKRKAYYRYF